jgi:hypothetical protein
LRLLTTNFLSKELPEYFHKRKNLKKGKNSFATGRIRAFVFLRDKKGNWMIFGQRQLKTVQNEFCCFSLFELTVQ